MNIFDFLVVQPIFNLLMLLYAVVPGQDFGIAIIIFTIFIRFVLYPMTRSMLHQSKAMRKLQPELAKIKKESGGDKQTEGRKMLELYKQHNVNPLRSIGILAIQLPIFFGLFYVIQIFTTHRDRIGVFTYDALESFAPIRALIDNPDRFNETLLGVVDLTKLAIHNDGVELFLIVLALVAGYTQYVMSKQTMPQQESKRRLRDIMAEAAEGKQADQAEMNAIVMSKMIKVLPIVMVVVMLSVPGALALYYAVSNIVAVVQQSYLLRQDTDELEELAAKAPEVKNVPNPSKKSSKNSTVTRIVATDTRKAKRRKT